MSEQTEQHEDKHIGDPKIGLVSDDDEQDT